MSAGRTPMAIHGVVPGSTAHLILLALRGVGGMSSDQISARFGHQSGALHRLKQAGMVSLPEIGGKGQPIALTDKAKRLTASGQPLCRQKTLITYCQL